MYYTNMTVIQGRIRRACNGLAREKERKKENVRSIAICKQQAHKYLLATVYVYFFTGKKRRKGGHILDIMQQSVVCFGTFITTYNCSPVSNRLAVLCSEKCLAEICYCLTR